MNTTPLLWAGWAIVAFVALIFLATLPMVSFALRKPLPRWKTVIAALVTVTSWVALVIALRSVTVLAEPFWTIFGLSFIALSSVGLQAKRT